MLKHLARTSILVLVLLAQAGCNYDILKDSGRRAIKEKATGGGADVIDFAAVKAKVLEPRCLECHGEGSSKGDFSTFAKALAYVTPKDTNNSELYQRLKNNGGDMPRNQSAIPDAEVTLLRAWIEAGAPETPGSTTIKPAPTEPPAPQPTPDGPQPAPQPPTQPPAPPAPPEPEPQPIPVPEPIDPAKAWSTIDAQVIQPKCVMCHGAVDPKGEIDLSSYEAIAADPNVLKPGNSAASAIVEVIADDFMPPKKARQAGKVQAVTAEELALIRAWIDAGASQ